MLAYLTATITSISTGIPAGSELMPTAERARRPASPNTSTKRSEHPLTDPRVVLEVRRGIDHSEHLDDTLDPIEIAGERLRNLTSHLQ
jgi:hypothetical protein